MTARAARRLVAGCVALLLTVALWIYTLVVPLDFVTYSPGLTVDVLAEQRGSEIVQVEGHRAYRDDGELRMTTVYVTSPKPPARPFLDRLTHPLRTWDELSSQVNLLDAVVAWARKDRAIYPYDAVYAPQETQEESRQESAIQMVSSQDAAIATALTELDYKVTEVTEVLSVDSDLPAGGKLQVRDVILKVDGATVKSAQQVVDAVDAAGTSPVRFTIRRDGKVQNVEVTPRRVDGDIRVGVVAGPGYQFPFDVSVRIPDTIGGPSAGLMFSLAIYDTLTPGSLTGGQVVAGTGTIDAQGRVGPIGGIQQKIVGAEQSGAKLFLVPPDNCDDALGAPVDDIRLVKATTMHEARESIQAWVKDPDADLPSCEKD